MCWSDEIPHPPPPDPVIRPRDPVLISIDTQTEGIFYKSAKRLQAVSSCCGIGRGYKYNKLLLITQRYIL